MTFFIEVLAGGLLAGVMYSLVALGFVLIYKASGVFNFAQGAMVFLAALTFVSLLEMGWNFWLALLVTLVVMVGVGVLTERIVLRPLVNQPPITLFMATIGLTFVLEGLSQMVWGSQPRAASRMCSGWPSPSRSGISVTRAERRGTGCFACWQSYW